MARGYSLLLVVAPALAAAEHDLRTQVPADPSEDDDSWWTAPWDSVAPDQFFVAGSSLLETGDVPSSLLGQKASEQDLQAQYVQLDGQWSSRRRHPRRRRLWIPDTIEHEYNQMTASLDAARQDLAGLNTQSMDRHARMQAVKHNFNEEQIKYLETLTDREFDLITQTGTYQDQIGEADQAEMDLDTIKQGYIDYLMATIVTPAITSESIMSVADGAVPQQQPSFTEMGSGKAAARTSSEYGDSFAKVVTDAMQEAATTAQQAKNEMANAYSEFEGDINMETHHARMAVDEEYKEAAISDNEQKAETDEAINEAASAQAKMSNDIEVATLLVGKDMKFANTKLGITEKDVEKNVGTFTKDLDKIVSDADSTWAKETSNLDKAGDKMQGNNEKVVQDYEKEAADALEEFNEDSADGFEDFQKEAEKDVETNEKTKEKFEKDMEKEMGEATTDVEAVKEQYELVRDHDASIREYVQDSGNSMKYATQHNDDSLKEEVKKSRDAFVENLGSTIGHLETNVGDSQEQMKGQIMESLNDLGEDASARPEEVNELKRGYVDQMNSDVEATVKEEDDVSNERKEASQTLKAFNQNLETLQKQYGDAWRELNSDSVKMQGTAKDLYAKTDAKMKGELQRTQNFIRSKAEELAGMPGEIATEYTKLKDSLQTATDNLQTAVTTMGMQIGSETSDVQRRAQQVAAQTEADFGQIDVMVPNMIEPMKRDFLKSSMAAERDKQQVNSSWTKAANQIKVDHRNQHKAFQSLVDKTAEEIEDSVAPKVQDAMVDDSRRLTNLRDVVNEFDSQQGSAAEAVMSQLKKMQKLAGPLAETVPAMQAQQAEDEAAVQEGTKVFGDDQISAAKTNFDADIKTAQAQAEGMLASDVSREKQLQEEGVQAGLTKLDGEITKTEEDLNLALANNQNKMVGLQKTSQERATEVSEETNSYQAKVGGLEAGIKAIESEAEQETTQIEDDARHTVKQGQEGLQEVQTDATNKLGGVQKDVIAMLHEAGGTYFNANQEWGEKFKGELSEEQKALVEKLRSAKEALTDMENKLKNANMQAGAEGKTAQSLVDGAGERFAGVEKEVKAGMEEEALKIGGNLDQKIASAGSSQEAAGNRLEGTTNVLGAEAGDLSRSAGDAVTLEGAKAEKQIKGEQAELDLFLQGLSEEERAAYMAQREKAKLLGDAFGGFEANVQLLQIAALREDNMTQAEKDAVIELINSERQQLSDNWGGLEKFCVESQERLVGSLRQQCETMEHQMMTITQDCDLVEHEQSKIDEGYEKMTGSAAYQTLLKIQTVDEFSGQVINDAYNIEQWMKQFTADSGPWRARVERIFGQSEEASRLFQMEQEITDAENKARLANMAASAERQLGSMVAEIGDGSGLTAAEQGFGEAMRAFHDKQRTVGQIEDQRIGGISDQMSSTVGEFQKSYTTAKGALSKLLTMDAGQDEKMHMITHLLTNIMEWNEEQAEHKRKVLAIRQQDVQDKLLLGGLPAPKPEEPKKFSKEDVRSMLEDIALMEKKNGELQDRHDRLGPQIDVLSAKLVKALEAVQAPVQPATVEATPATAAH